MNMGINIIEIIQLAIILLVSIGVHEFAHAWMSDKLGDPTPQMMGRLTPNPLAHIDPIGFIMIFLVHFGRGKPVVTNPHYYRRPLRDECLVAFIGPLSNIILASIAIIIIMIITKIGLTNVIMLTDFWSLFAQINCGLAIFNMLPLPPLDGWRLVKLINPHRAGLVQQISYRYVSVTFVLLFLLSKILLPIVSLVSAYLYHYLHSFFFVLFLL